MADTYLNTWKHNSFNLSELFMLFTCFIWMEFLLRTRAVMIWIHWGIFWNCCLACIILCWISLRHCWCCSVMFYFYFFHFFSSCSHVPYPCSCLLTFFFFFIISSPSHLPLFFFSSYILSCSFSSSYTRSSSPLISFSFTVLLPTLPSHLLILVLILCISPPLLFYNCCNWGECLNN